jgi:hypothetical protein
MPITRSPNAARVPAAQPPAGRDEMQNILAGSATDQTYKNEWKKFTTWVDDNFDDEDINNDIEMDPPPEHGGTGYLTRGNLDAYFKYEVVYRNGTKETINRIVHALKHYSWFKESSVIAPDVAGALFVSQVMQTALLAQNVRHRKKDAIDSSLDDKCPHRFCKHTLSLQERMQVLTVAMQGTDWQNSTVAINLGHNVAIRGASTRNLTLCDLRLANGYGPGSNKADGAADPRFDRTLMIILRKGPIHKDRFKTTKQVGMWRHRQWLLDPNFSIALAVIYNLRREGSKIKFTLQTGGNTTRPAWWNHKLISWETLKGTLLPAFRRHSCFSRLTWLFFYLLSQEHTNAYLAIYKNAGVRGVKVTHDRTVAIQNMSSLSPYQISSFTKHIVDNKLSAAYQAEADYEACLVQSGFRKGEEWFVPEATIKLSESDLRRWERHLLPKIDSWRQNRRGPGGDKSECADNFLNKTIPFLVEVAVQCGIHFILAFPNHEMAQVLMSFPGYEVWANEKRQECVRMVDSRGEQVMHNLDAATRASYERLHRRVDQMEDILHRRVDQMEGMVERLVNQNAQLIEEVRTLSQNLQPHQQHEQREEQQQPHQPPPPPQAAPPAVLPLRQATRPRVPMVQRKLPDSFVEIWEEWRANQLASFMNAKAKLQTWGSEVYNAWHKRRLIVQKIEELAKAEGVDFEIKLQQIEQERLQTKNRKGTRAKSADMTMLREWYVQQGRKRKSSETRGRGRQDEEENEETSDEEAEAPAATAPRRPRQRQRIAERMTEQEQPTRRRTRAPPPTTTTSSSSSSSSSNTTNSTTSSTISSSSLICSTTPECPASSGYCIGTTSAGHRSRVQSATIGHFLEGHCWR